MIVLHELAEVVLRFHHLLHLGLGSGILLLCADILARKELVGYVEEHGIVESRLAQHLVAPRPVLPAVHGVEHIL